MGGSGDAIPGPLARLVRNTAALFEPVDAPAAPRNAEKYLLLAVLVLAAFVRFWELGSFSLHKSDEDTTVLAAAHILEDGTPRFPSGMFYARAIVQSYLIAGSFMAFGESEWSARLPSALCGILVVWLGWLVARRFLSGPWRIAFALSLALLPMLVADSQEARMYIFMVAALLAATWQTFLWEHGWAARHLVFAVLWMLVAIQFQSLALLGGAVLLFPGLVAGDLRRTLQGVAALVVVGAGYLLINGWQVGFYPETATAEYFPGWMDPLVVGAQPGTGALPMLVALLLVAVGVTLVLRATRGAAGIQRWIVIALVALALLHQALLHYHVAALCWLGALVLAWRGTMAGRGLLLWLVAAAGAIAAAQLGLLVAGGEPLRQAVGQMVGWPSIWPLLQLRQFSLVAALLVALGVAVALFRLAGRQRISEVWMYFILTAWVPLIVVGLNAWFVPPRYIEFALVPLLLTAFVLAAGVTRRQWAAATPLVAVAVAALLVNPVAAWEAVAVGDRAADHRGAARFLQQLPLRDDDIVIAEEVLMQSYYLDGRVDYWLVSPQAAAQFVVVRDGHYVDQYTHSRLVDSVAALEKVVADADGRRVFIIGSAEGGNRLHFRGAELDRLLASGELPVVYEGANGSRIWAPR